MLISIVTVTYNADATIEKLIKNTRNVLCNFPDIEHVIIDGASNDRTVEILHNYSSSLSNVKFVSEPDTGIFNAMNKGINLSTGDYVIHLNGDDWIHDLINFSFIYDLLKKKRPVILSTPVLIYKGDKLHRLLPAKPLNNLHANFGYHFPHQGTLFSREVFELTNAYNEIVGYVADKIFSFQLLDLIPISSIMFIDKPTFAQASGGISSRSPLTPIRTFALTIKASEHVSFKAPFTRAVSNLFFKMWLYVYIKIRRPKNFTS